MKIERVIFGGNNYFEKIDIEETLKIKNTIKRCNRKHPTKNGENIGVTIEQIEQMFDYQPKTFYAIYHHVINDGRKVRMPLYYVSGTKREIEELKELLRN